MEPLRLATVAACALLAGCRTGAAPDAAAPRDAPPADAVADAPPAVDAAVDAAADAGAPTRRVVVTLTGDVVLHRAVLQTFERHRAQGGAAWSLNWLSALVTPREVALTWLDSPLTDAYRAPFEGAPMALGAPRALAPSFARDLARVGLDGVCLATQHAYDQAAEGLGETAAALRAANLGVAGVGASDDEAWRPWVTEREGVRVAWLCFTQRTWQAPGRNPEHLAVARSEEAARAVAAVAAARAAADVVVVGVQWSRAPFRALSDEQRALARQLVDAGADVVAGSGGVAPGVAERVRSPRGDALVVWSTGTLLSNYGSLWRGASFPAPTGVDRSAWDPASRDAVVLRAQFDVADPAHLRIVTLTANALWTQHGPDGVRPIPLRAVTDFDLRESRMRAVTQALGAEVRVRQ